MDVNLAHGASTNSVSLPFNEVLPALSNKTLFWRPKFLANDQGVAHIPFLFWIVESIRPDITVQLGFGNGSSYYAVCQAIDKLDISGSCYAIEPNLDVKQQYNEAQYHEFSRLQDLPYDRAVEQFKSQSIDLLHINLSADHVTLTQLLAVWLPYLSEKAVILVQNSQTSEQPNFVSLCQQLKKQYSTFELVQENGLLAIAVAQIPSESFARLLTFQLHSKAYDLVQNVFARLGKACSEVVRTQNALEQVQQVQSQLHEREQELEISQQKIAELLKSLNDHKTWLSNRKNEVADLGDQLKSSVESAAQEHAQAEQRVRMLEQVRSELKQEIETLFSHVETLRNEQHTIKLEAEKWQKNAQALSEGKNELNQLLINVSVELESVKTSLEQQREENNSLQNKLTAQHNQHVEQLKQLNSDQEIVCQRLRDDALQELDEVKRQLGNQLAQANEERVLAEIDTKKLHDAYLVRIETLQQKIVDQNDNFALMTARSQSEIDQLSANIELEKKRRFDETVALTRLLSDTKTKLRSTEEELANRTTDSTARCEQLQQQISDLQQQYQRCANENGMLKAASLKHELMLKQHTILSGQQRELAKTQTERNELCHLLVCEQRKNAQLQRIGRWSIARPFFALMRRWSRNDAEQQLVKQREQLLASGLFDTEYYKQRYPDVAASEVDVVTHYLKYGAYEGRNPNANFISSFYLNEYADVRSSGINPLVHYIRFGLAEQRKTAPEKKGK